MADEVHRIVLAGPADAWVTLDLDEECRKSGLGSWEKLPSTFRDFFAQVDADHNGTLVVSAKHSMGQEVGGRKIEIGSTNQWRLLRLFQGLGGDNPYVDGRQNLATQKIRTQFMNNLRDQVASKVMPSAGEKNLGAWIQAEACFALMADFRHLHQGALVLEKMYEETSDRTILELAHHFLMEATRFAGFQEDGRLGGVTVERSGQKPIRLPWYRAIRLVKTRIGQALDRLDGADFSSQKEHPYVLREGVLSYERRFLKDNPRIVLRVSLPAKYHGDLLTYFREHPVALRSGVDAARSVALVPHGTVARRGGLNETYYDDSLVSGVLFNEGGHIDKLVAFELPADVSPSLLSPDQGWRLWDLQVTNPDGRTAREIKGAVLIQDKWDQAVNYTVSADQHHDERGYWVLPYFLEAYQKIRRFVEGGATPPYWRQALKGSEDPDLRMEYMATVAPFVDPVKRMADRIRFAAYSTNEHATDLWSLLKEDQYQPGAAALFPDGAPAMRDFIEGDWNDFVNADPKERRPQDFRQTNFPRGLHVLSSTSDRATQIGPGNHLPHRSGPSHTFRWGNFAYDMEIKEWAPYLDWEQFGKLEKAALAWVAAECLENEYAGNSLLYAMRMLKAPEEKRYDQKYDGLGPYYRNINTVDLSMTRLNKAAAYLSMDTGVEDFMFEDHVEHRAKVPLLPSLWKGIQSYLVGFAANLNGPKPKVFGKFVALLRQAAQEGVYLNVSQHAALVHGEEGPDGTPKNEDTLRGPVKKSEVLMLWAHNYDLMKAYGRLKTDHGRSGPVAPLTTCFHVHSTEAFFVKFELGNEEQEQVFREVMDVADQAIKDPYHISYAGRSMDVYEACERIWEKHTMSGKFKVKAGESAEEAYHLMQEFNADNQKESADHGFFVVNGPSAGHPTAGLLKVSASPEGRFSILPHYIVQLPTGKVLDSEDALSLDRVRGAHQDLWLQSIGLKPVDPKREEDLRQANLVRPEILQAKIKKEFEGVNGVDQQARFDPFRLISCPSNFICPRVGGHFGGAVVYRDGMIAVEGVVSGVFEVQFPLIRDPRPGEPGELHVGARVSEKDGWSAHLGLGWSGYRAYFDTNFREFFGLSAEIKNLSWLPLGSLGVGAYFKLRGEQAPVDQIWQLFWRFDITGPSYRLFGRYSDY